MRKLWGAIVVFNGGFLLNVLLALQKNNVTLHFFLPDKRLEVLPVFALSICSFMSAVEMGLLYIIVRKARQREKRWENCVPADLNIAKLKMTDKDIEPEFRKVWAILVLLLAIAWPFYMSGFLWVRFDRGQAWLNCAGQHKQLISLYSPWSPCAGFDWDNHRYGSWSKTDADMIGVSYQPFWQPLLIGLFTAASLSAAGGVILVLSGNHRSASTSRGHTRKRQTHKGRTARTGA